MEPGPRAAGLLKKRLDNLLHNEGVKLSPAPDAWETQIGLNVDYCKAVTKFDEKKKHPFLW